MCSAFSGCMPDTFLSTFGINDGEVATSKNNELVENKYCSENYFMGWHPLQK